MALVSLRQLLDHAAENNYGMPAFNINNMEQMLAIMDAADKTDSPVIMQASRGARKYANDTVLRHLIQAAAEMYPHIPICMHQDHGNNAATCMSAIASGFSSVMMDGSLEEDAKTPASYDYNVEITAKVTEMAHLVGVSVEGELGCLGSLETGMGDAEDGHGFEGALDKDMLVTDPDEAADFINKTKCDALAVAIGTSHGAYKFTRKPTGDILAMDVVNIKISKFGGLTKARQARDLCMSLGVAMTLEDTWGGDIVTAAISHLAHSTPKDFLFSATDFNSYVTKPIAHGAPQRKEGRMRSSTEPGLGVDPIMEVLGDPVLEIG